MAVTEAETQKPRKERTENAARRRRQLLDAARRSVLRHGLAKTTLATVATEAGLSQGVAVFYFSSKAGLLTETLRDLYHGYERHWQTALAEAGDEPLGRLVALVEADFHTDACGPDILPLWFAFWGELHFQAQYEQVAADFDLRRHTILCAIFRDLLPDRPAQEAEQVAEWMDTLTDGYWQRLHLASGHHEAQAACAATKQALARLVPELRARLTSD